MCTSERKGTSSEKGKNLAVNWVGAGKKIICVQLTSYVALAQPSHLITSTVSICVKEKKKKEEEKPTKPTNQPTTLMFFLSLFGLAYVDYPAVEKLTIQNCRGAQHLDTASGHGCDANNPNKGSSGMA